MYVKLIIIFISMYMFVLLSLVRRVGVLKVSVIIVVIVVMRDCVLGSEKGQQMYSKMLQLNSKKKGNKILACVIV